MLGWTQARPTALWRRPSSCEPWRSGRGSASRARRSSRARRAAASRVVRAREKRQGSRSACPEEIAFAAGWISREDLRGLGARLAKSSYGQYLLSIAEGHL